MKKVLLVIFVMIFCRSFSQVQNGSFENGSSADLSHWEWTCGAQSVPIAPPGGGSWCMEIDGGNPQSCYPGYAYQKIPVIVNGEPYLLTGWAFAMTSPEVGIYFGVINNGVISLQAGITTPAISWAPLSVQSSYNLGPGDTALVVLFGGVTGGPTQGYGYFDLIDLQLATGIITPGHKHALFISPNPFSSHTILHSDINLQDASLLVYNSLGQQVREIKNISGQTVFLPRDGLPAGMYFCRLIQEHQALIEDKIIITDF